MLNIGILGCGRIGQVHGKTLKGMDTARAVAVSDFLPEACLLYTSPSPRA